ncbi:MAG: FecR domain-containing protein [Planctomycetes bacterium]|nr:FecR domain-containing protein [Planctomycetota bacterium]
MKSDYLWDPSTPPSDEDADVRRLEALLARHRHAERGTPRWRERPTRRPWIALAACAAAAAVVVAWLLLRDTTPHWEVHGLVGQDRVHPGETLENSGAADVRVAIGAIGEVAVAPGARLRAEDCGGARHSLYLERGRLHARIVAAPRVFQIDTPAGRTIDLGCEYEVEVREDGATRVRVTEGQIEFVFDGREVYVPANARCDALPGAGPGLPEFEERSNALSDVLVIASGMKTVVAKAPGAILDGFLADCTDEDTLTLWHLYDSDTGGGKAVAAEGWVRERIFARLARQFPFPHGVTEDALHAGDRAARRAWRDSMQPAWRVQGRPR